MVCQKSDVCILCRIVHGLFNFHLIKSDSIFSLTHHLFVFDCFMAQQIQGNLVQAVAPVGGVEQVGGNHGIKDHALHGNATPGKHNVIVFDVLPHFGYGCVFQDGFDKVQDCLAIGLLKFFIAKGHMPHGNIICFMGFMGKRDTHKFRTHGVFRSGFGVNGKNVSLFEAVQLLFDFCQVCEADISLFHGFWFRGELLLKLPEFKFLEQGGKGIIVRGNGFKLFNLKRNFYVLINGHQTSA